MEDSDVLMSRVPIDRRTLWFDKDLGIHTLKVRLMDDSLISGHACNHCSTKLGPGEQDTYFCPDRNIFMCKHCLLNAHHPRTTSENPEHSDFLVKVEFSSNGN